MTDFSVVVCTFNGAKRLPQVLEKLKAQQFTQPCRWEVIVVDNNSRDRTPEIVQTYQQNWLPRCPCATVLSPVRASPTPVAVLYAIALPR
jgi:glycosyltransferase involved in cell wall biosynthesis